MESGTDRTRFVGDASVFLHRARLPQDEFQRVFNGASALIALAHWAPEKIQTVKELEDQITLFPGKMLALERRTGLREKRVYDKNAPVVDFAMKAVDELIRKRTFDGAPIPLNEIDLILYFAVAREYEEPATAVLIQKRLGLSGQMAFDISDACMGFIDAWCIADAMIADKRIRKALLVGAERTSILTENAIKIINSGGDPFDQFASFTIGDGAVAAIVGPKSTSNRGINLKAGIRESYGEHSGLCIMKSYHEGILKTQTKQLVDTALTKFAPLAVAVLDHLGWNKESIDMIIPHQVSVPATRRGAEILGVPFEKCILTFPEYGNMGAVAIPFTLSIAIDKQNALKKRRIISVALASGIGIGVLGLETYGQ